MCAHTHTHKPLCSCSLQADPAARPSFRSVISQLILARMGGAGALGYVDCLGSSEDGRDSQAPKNSPESAEGWQSQHQQHHHQQQQQQQQQEGTFGGRQSTEAGGQVLQQG